MRENLKKNFYLRKNKIISYQEKFYFLLHENYFL
jgi:hypothetical protein